MHQFLSFSAVAYEDFRPVDLDVIFNKYTPSVQTVSVPILNDICLEEDGEYFSVVATSFMDCVQIVNESVTIRIDDDDSESSFSHNQLLLLSSLFLYIGAKITLDDSFYKVYEDGGSVYVCVLLKTEIKRDVEFTLTVTDLTAQGEHKC